MCTGTLGCAAASDDQNRTSAIQRMASSRAVHWQSTGHAPFCPSKWANSRVTHGTSQVGALEPVGFHPAIDLAAIAVEVFGSRANAAFVLVEHALELFFARF